MQNITLEEKLNRRALIKSAGITQRSLAKYLSKYPQQVHDATNGLQPGLWVIIEKILNSERLIKQLKSNGKSK